MQIGIESDRDDIKPRHKKAVPGLGVFIAPKAIGRLFQLHDYTRCVDLQRRVRSRRVLYPILRPNVMHSPRYYHLLQATHAKRKYYGQQRKDGSQDLRERLPSQGLLWN